VTNNSEKKLQSAFSVHSNHVDDVAAFTIRFCYISEILSLLQSSTVVRAFSVDSSFSLYSALCRSRLAFQWKKSLPTVWIWLCFMAIDFY